LRAGLEFCHIAFNSQNVAELEQCFDPDIMLFLHSGEFRGREAALAHIRQRYFSQEGARLEMRHTEVRLAGDTAWSTYEYSYRRASEGRAGQGMMVLRRTSGKWRMLSMHDFPYESASSSP
ncbi:MAG: DUF4440 domain-containing protein, partial [Terriglobales bacterium]